VSECGTIAARALFMVFYRDEGGVQIAYFPGCCARHEPAGFTILVDEAEVLQTDIADAYEQVVMTDRAALVYLNPVPGHYVNPVEPWSWTRGDNHPRSVRAFDPDRGFHVETEGG
jgi:hypothetical protein